MKALVLSIGQYDFEDDRGTQIMGTKVMVVDLEQEPKQNTRGMEPSKITIGYGQASDFQTVPGIYNIDFNIVPGAGGKVKAVYSKATFIKDFKIAG